MQVSSSLDVATAINVNCAALFGVPAANSDAKRNADEHLRSLLERAARAEGPVIDGARAILVDPTSSDASRHFALQCMQAGIGHMSRTASSPAQLAPLQSLCMELVSRASKGVLSDQRFVKAKVADAVGDAVTRLWPQRWPDFLPSFITASASSPSACELSSMVLTSVACVAGSADFSTRLPPTRRSEVVAGLTATVEQWGGHFSGVLDSCVDIMRAGQAAGPVSPATASQLCSEVLGLVAAASGFLPPPALRQINPNAAALQAWYAVSLVSNNPAAGVSRPLAARVIDACVAVLEATGGRRWDNAGDADVAASTLAAAIGICAAAQAPGYSAQSWWQALPAGVPPIPPSRPHGLPDSSCAAPGPGMSTTLDSASFRALACAACEAITSHVPHVLAAAINPASIQGKRVAEANPSCSMPSHTLRQALALLLALLQHASPVVRAAAASTASSLLQQSAWPKDAASCGPALPVLSWFYTSIAPVLLSAMVKEPRVVLHSLPPPGRPSPPATPESLTPADVLLISREDVEDDDEEELGYVSEVARARAGKALAALAQLAPEVVLGTVRAAVDDTAALCLAPPSPPAASTFYGGHAPYSRAGLHLDALSAGLMAVTEGLLGDGHGHGMGHTALSIACYDHMQHIAQALITCLRDATDPWLRAGLAAAVGHTHGFLARLGQQGIPLAPGAAPRPSLLPFLLETLFSGVEYGPPAQLQATAETFVASVEAAVASGRKVAVPPNDRRQHFRNMCQFARQRCCSALVSLARRIPSLLLPALQPMADRAGRLLSLPLPATVDAAGVGTTLAAADRVSLFEMLLLVSNALAGQDPAAHASFVQAVIAGPVQAWTANAAHLATPQALLSHLGLASSPASFATVKTTGEALFNSLHIMWAIARRCTAGEMCHAVTGSYGGGPGFQVDILDIPAHPFAVYWPAILQAAVGLISSLQSLWASGAIASLSGLHLDGAQGQGQGACAAHLLFLAPDEQRILSHVGRGDLAPKQSSGPGRGDGSASARGVGDNGDGSDSDGEDDEGRAGAGAKGTQALVTMVVPSADANGAVSMRTAKVSPQAHQAACWLATWYGRCMWHAHALVALAGEAHVPGRKQACGLVALHGTPAGTDAQALLSRSYGPTGVYGLMSSPDPASTAMLASVQGMFLPDRLAAMPTRTLRNEMVQVLPGLIVGCPPTARAAAWLAGLVEPLVGEMARRLGTVAAQGPEAASMRHVGPLVTPASGKGKKQPKSAASAAGGSTPAAERQEPLVEAVVRDALRASLDTAIILMPPHETWYSLRHGEEPGPTPASSATPATAQAVTEKRTLHMTMPGLGQCTVLPAAPTDPGSSSKSVAEAMAAGQAPPLLTVGPVLSTHAFLGSAGLAQAWCGVLLAVFDVQDTVALKKACVLLGRLLPMLSAAALQLHANVPGSSLPQAAAVALPVWTACLGQLFGRGLEALVMGRPFTATAENELAALLADVYLRLCVGVGLEHPGPIAATLAHLAGTGSSSGQASSLFPVLPLDGQAVPRQVLRQAMANFPLTSATGPQDPSTRLAAWEERVAGCPSDRERRAAMRDVLQELAASVDAQAAAKGLVAGTGAAGGGSTLRPGHTTAGSSARGGSVASLPERLLMPGRGPSLGLGSSTVVSSQPLDEEAGLGSLFGTE